MGVLKYALLGLLNRRSMTGYDLKKELESDLAEFWTAQHSQIYPELKHLYQEGTVDFIIEIAGTSLEKKLYTITEAGRQDFAEWLERAHKMPPTPKDEFKLQLYFSDCLTVERRLHLLNDQLYQHRDRLRHLQRNQEKFRGIPPVHTAAFGDYLVLMGAIMREEASCAWLEQCIELCNSQS